MILRRFLLVREFWGWGVEFFDCWSGCDVYCPTDAYCDYDGW